MNLYVVDARYVHTIYDFFFNFRITGDEVVLARSMGPPGWAYVHTHGAILVH